MQTLVLSLLSADAGVKVRLLSLKAREACMGLLQELIKAIPEGLYFFATELSAVIQGDIKVSQQSR